MFAVCIPLSGLTKLSKILLATNNAKVMRETHSSTGKEAAAIPRTSFGLNVQAAEKRDLEPFDLRSSFAAGQKSSGNTRAQLRLEKDHMLEVMRLSMIRSAHRSAMQTSLLNVEI